MRLPTVSTAAVTAVYVDELEKKRRANGVIVTGLKPSPIHSDQRLFSNLCSTELSIQPDIVFNKRLGQILPGKTQPLLVIMRDPIQAQQVTATARLLRKSTYQDIVNNVYINAYLTRAEAAAEYQLRVQRRAYAKGRGNHRPISSNGSNAVDNQVNQVNSDNTGNTTSQRNEPMLIKLVTYTMMTFHSAYFNM